MNTLTHEELKRIEQEGAKLYPNYRIRGFFDGLRYEGYIAGATKEALRAKIIKASTMTPEQKAKELVDKFSPAASQYDYNASAGWKVNEEETKENATACARICVEEIIRVLKFELDYPMLKSVEYWNEVLNHLK